MSNLEKLQKKRALTLSEAAEYACVSRGTVEHWITQGLLPFEELPGTGTKQRFRRIRRKDLEAFLDGKLKVNRTRGRKPDQEKYDEVFLIPKNA